MENEEISVFTNDSTALSFVVHNADAGNKSNVAVGHVWTKDVEERVAIVSFIMVCTILGNTTLILTIMCKHSRRIKRVNIFLLNLAIGDLAVACFTNTTEILFLAFDEWILGNILCKVCVYLQIVTFSSATFLLMAMSIDRYQVIVKPLQALASWPRTGRKVFLAWLMAFIFASPQLLIFVQVEKGTKFDGTPRRACLSHGYTAEWQRKVYFTYMTLYILVIPSSVMLFCYINIVSVVWSRAGDSEYKRSEKHPEDERITSPRMSVRRGLVTAAKRRAVILTLTVVIGFLVCLTPYFIITLIRIYSNYAIKLSKSLAVAESIFMTHSAFNPILYGLFTLRRRHLRRALKRFSCNKRVKTINEKNRLLNGSAGSHRKTGTHAKTNCQSDRSISIYADRPGKRTKSVFLSNPQELSLLGNVETDRDIITLNTGNSRTPNCNQWFSIQEGCQTQCLSSV